MEGAPNLEKLYEQKITNKLSYSIQALLGLHKDRDRQLVGLMSKAVIPPLLVLAKDWYQHQIKRARSKRYIDVLTGIYEDMISPLVDLFSPVPIPIETMLKDRATEHGEINVFGLTSGQKYTDDWDEEEVQKEKDMELDRLEAKMRGKLGRAYQGPRDGEDEDEFFGLGEEVFD